MTNSACRGWIRLPVCSYVPCRRIGAVLLLIGGLLEAARLIVFTLISPVGPVLASIAVNVGPSTCIGAGLIAVSVSIPGRGRLRLLIAGILYLAAVAVNIVQIATVMLSPFGPGPSFLAWGATFIAVVVAAAVLLSDRALLGPARWAIAIPAAGIVLLIVGVYAPLLGSVRIDLLPRIGFAIAGGLLLRRPTPHLIAASPVVT